ncbi:MAG TPA: CPBP family intramembrane metalloprotease [Clostridiaceae bacterium]|nr:CPBP family intramembrane metalloprotease [Clostridiaceae bacterium]
MKNKKVTVTGANIVFLAFVLSYMLSQFILSVFMSILVFTGSIDSPVQFIKNNIYILTFVNEYFLILGPVLIYAFAKNIDFKYVFRFKSPGLLPTILIILMAVPAYFVALALNSTVIYFLQFIGRIPTQPIPVPRNIPELLAGLFFIAATPGICEEMLHRGLILRAYERRGTIKALVISSIFFGIFHFDITNLLGPIFLGLLIGYYVIRTDSIFAGIIAHFLNNAFAELLQFFLAQEVEAEYLSISGRDLLATILYGMAGLIVLSILITIFKKVTNKRSTYKPPISSVRDDIISVISHWPIIIIILVYTVTAAFYLLTLALV